METTPFKIWTICKPTFSRAFEIRTSPVFRPPLYKVSYQLPFLPKHCVKSDSCLGILNRAVFSFLKKQGDKKIVMNNLEPFQQSFLSGPLQQGDIFYDHLLQSIFQSLLHTYYTLQIIQMFVSLYNKVAISFDHRSNHWPSNNG